MTKIYYDAEFTGLHRNSTFISLGMVSESGNTFYAEFTDYDRYYVTDWIQDNVIANLQLPTTKDCPQFYTSNIPTGVTQSVGTSDDNRGYLLKWLENEANGGQLQFIVDCYAYDWMLLVDLLTNGKTALDMPEYIHYIPLDLSTMLWMSGEDPDISREQFALNPWTGVTDIHLAGPKHNALFDARVIKLCYGRINYELRAIVTDNPRLPFN